MYSILFVDDEENTRKSFINSVDWASLGFKIIGAVSNGITALEYIEQYDIDLLVTDIKMPVMGGIELARETREMRPSMQIVFLSGHDQFNFAKEAIKYNVLEYLLKPITSEQIIQEFTIIKTRLDEKFSEILNVDEHQDVINQLKNVQKEVFLSKIINNGLSLKQLKQYENVLMPFSIKEDSDKMYVLLIFKNENNEQSEQEIKLKRLYKLTKVVAGKYTPCLTFIFANTVIVLVQNNKRELEKYISVLNKDIVLSCKRIINMSLHCAQSDYYSNILDSHIAYQQTLSAIKAIENTDTEMVQIQDIPISKIMLNQELIENTLLNKNEDDITELISSLYKSVQNDVDNYHVLSLQLLGILFIISSELSMGDREEIVKTITDNQDMSMENILKLCLFINNKVMLRRDQSADTLVQSSLQCMENEFDNLEMSLKYLAKKIHCSPNYLSSIIKKTTGNTFVDILTTIRMKKASDLLRNTQNKIGKIALECGYANQHYFSYAFKKYYNQSPNAHRKVNA